jgi:hypothetical protein
VIVGVSGSVRSLAALRVAVAEARRVGALLLPVLAWSPVGGEVAYRRGPCPPLLRVWEQMAGERMRTAFDEAYGGRPPGWSFNRSWSAHRPVPLWSRSPGDAPICLWSAAGRKVESRDSPTVQ